MNEEEKLKKYVSIVPNSRQLIVQEMKFYAFVHYTVNTFTGREWGTGKESPSVFNPKCQNTDKWCEAIKSAGMKGVILTCKHHDGFCLWQTKTTKHSIASSPYKNGLGDVVKEVSDSCKKYGLKFGVYLSPWDRNSEYYSTEKYNDFYIEQLTELLTNYGDFYVVA
ncbi:MAG: alpha-L-fucosidase [Clostridia bacterium]